MAEVPAAERTEELIAELTEVWESSVRASHLFLTEADIAQIRLVLPQAFTAIEHLVLATSLDGRVVGFMGVQANRLEMLFLSAPARGKGIGTRLLKLAMEDFGVTELTVNEQNPDAARFYCHHGFRVYKRSETDEDGRPFPLLYMRYCGEGKQTS